MKFLKYFFYALLPIMLLMMFFSYSNFSFISSKAGASSTTNTINFYGKDNYLIGSYDVPNGQSINDVVDIRDITTSHTIDFLSQTFGYYWNSNRDYRVSSNIISNFTNTDYENTYNYLSVRKNGSLGSYAGISFCGGLVLNDFNYNYPLALSFTSKFTYTSTPILNFCEVNLCGFVNEGDVYSKVYTLGLLDMTTTDVTYTYNDTINIATGSIDLSTIDLWALVIDFQLENTQFNKKSYNFLGYLYPEVISQSYKEVITERYVLADVINADIQYAITNGYLTDKSNYSWSTQSNFNNDFTFDTHIFYDLDLYYLQDNKVFNFANGWQTTLGDLSNLTFFTNTALAELIEDFNNFTHLNFNGDFLQVLKSIGLAIANIFNLIISLSSLIVAPLIDMVSIIVLLITKSSFFWTFT